RSPLNGRSLGCNEHSAARPAILSAFLLAHVCRVHPARSPISWSDVASRRMALSVGRCSCCLGGDIGGHLVCDSSPDKFQSLVGPPIGCPCVLCDSSAPRPLFRGDGHAWLLLCVCSVLDRYNGWRAPLCRIPSRKCAMALEARCSLTPRSRADCLRRPLNANVRRLSLD